MIEFIILEYLSGVLDVPVFMEFPADPPSRFVLLHKSGSGRVNFVDSAMIVADSYGGTLLDAAKLNEAVKAALDDMPELPNIGGTRLQNDYPAFDTDNKRYRYQAVYDITY